MHQLPCKVCHTRDLWDVGIEEVEVSWAHFELEAPEFLNSEPGNPQTLKTQPSLPHLQRMSDSPRYLCSSSRAGMSKTLQWPSSGSIVPDIWGLGVQVFRCPGVLNSPVS